MDKKQAEKESFVDATRESLIEISYQLPKDLQEVDVDKEVVEAVISDGYEKYRSKLISISHSSSPNAKVLPVSPGQPNP